MDRGEFNRLVLAAIQAVYRLAYHLSRRPQEADGLVQETYAFVGQGPLRSFPEMR